MQDIKTFQNVETTLIGNSDITITISESKLVVVYLDNPDPGKSPIGYFFRHETARYLADMINRTADQLDPQG